LDGAHRFLIGRLWVIGYFMKASHSNLQHLLHLAGVRCWTASIMPALVGITLPFWLDPPAFSFRWSGALAFVAATVLLYSGFSLLMTWIEGLADRSEMQCG